MVISYKLTLYLHTGEACWDTQHFHPITLEGPLNINRLDSLTGYEFIKGQSVPLG